MNKFVRPLLALALVATVCGAGAHAVDYYETGYGNDFYSSQINYDSFHLSARKRLESVRIGSSGQSFGTFTTASAGGFSSDGAYAAPMAPSSRVGSYSSARRRQLDCVYYSGFTVWADLYQTWAKQQSEGGDDGYKHKIFGPALGFDWTSGPFTIGVAGTYGWGKMTSRDLHNDRRSRQWAAEVYAQYNADLFYINATVGYGHNTIRSNRTSTITPWSYGDKYATNSVNLDAEFGWKFNWSGLQVTPHAGVRFFHDRRGSIDEGEGIGAVKANSRNYHTFEIPVGVTVGYEINTNGMTFVPRARFGYTPELFREDNRVDGRMNVGGTTGWVNGSEDAARRSRNGFNLGLGLEAKITKSISAHVDYSCSLRPDQYEHHWNAGLGFTF